MITAFVIIVYLLAIIYLLPKTKLKQNNTQIRVEPHVPEIDEIFADYYYHKSLLTPHEKAFYNILKSKVNEQNWTVNCKTRLEDIIETKAKGKKKMSDRGKIKSRHVDFAVLDDKMNILFCIELDDSSHSAPDSIESDDFKNELFSAVGLNLYRVQSGCDFNLKIDKIIQSYLSNW